MPQTSALCCPYWAPNWVPELHTHKLLKCLRLSQGHFMWLRQWWFSGCSIPCGFFSFQEADVAVTCSLYLALMLTRVLSHAGTPPKSVPAAEAGIVSIPALFEVLMLSTSQWKKWVNISPVWRLPKLWLGRRVGAGEGGICRQRLTPTSFPFLSVSSLLSWKCDSLMCDAAPFSQEKLSLTSILLSSFSNQLHIIHICWEIWSQLKETNDFCKFC